MASAKKYRVKVRVKVRHRILKKTGLALSMCAGAAVIGCCGLLAVRTLPALYPSRFFSFTVKSLSVKSPSKEISAEITRRMAGKIGASFSRKEAEALAASLKTAYPSLSRVDVERNFFGGRVSVDAAAENVVAKVRLAALDRSQVHGGRAQTPGNRAQAPRGRVQFPAAPVPDGEKIFYLAENGKLLGEHYGPEPGEMFETEVRAAPGDALIPLAAFLKEFRALSAGFSSRPVRLEYPAPRSETDRGPAKSLRETDRGSAKPLSGEADESCRLTLENGASVLWGDFEFTKAKISRLNEVLSDAARRLNGPLRVDLRYFRDGKVFVSKLSDI
jgi:hypothetical protein